MREHLFHAKRLRDGEWVEGSFCCAEKLDKTGTEYFIIEYSADEGAYPVDPDTVGQYIGTTDKNGRRIFENDIVLHNNKRFVVSYFTKYARFAGAAPGCVMAIFFFNYCEVIGNVYDNPELMDQEGDKNAG